ncbi:hypothetical protein MNBD_GAMMA01-1158 [hydrothermal vent metagenome]|uniref:Uncharacterized protein n=1 Tax=hydrothermal vent metagenome TaxID=652676 RepID=A0A3B0UXR5_9ZZZZ
MKKILLSLIVLTTVHIQAKAGLAPELLFVGQGGGFCIYNDIQDAIDLANLNPFVDYEIRVTNEFTRFENLTITRDLTIKGGYSNCGLAQLDSRLDANRTVVDAGAVGSAVNISGSVNNFNMSGFTLSNAAGATGGAVVISSADAEINFEQMNISTNAGDFGGGIFMNAANISLILSNTLVDNNTALTGGGIYCLNSGFISLRNNSGILGNQANGAGVELGNGGGIYSSGCTISLASGQGAVGAFSLVGVSSNFATNSGGGVFMNGGWLNTAYADDMVINIDNNVANSDMDDIGDGGGVFLMNDAVITLSKMYFANNTVFNGNGGALFMDNSRYNANSFWFLGYDDCILDGYAECNLFINNRAVGGGFNLGGAIYMQNNSAGFNVNSSLRARFINNRADGAAAIAVYSGSTLNVQNSYFIGNGNNGADDTSDFNVIRVVGAGSEIDVSFSTLANNHNAYTFALLSGGQVSLSNSIVYEQTAGNDVVFPTDNEQFSIICNLFHEGVTPGPLPIKFNNSLITTNPGFVNPANDNYQLRFDSPAIDRCGTLGISSDIEIRMDLDTDIRPIDIPNLSNGLGAGAYDAGADEYNDVIFANDFE